MSQCLVICFTDRFVKHSKERMLESQVEYICQILNDNFKELRCYLSQNEENNGFLVPHMPRPAFQSICWGDDYYLNWVHLQDRQLQNKKKYHSINDNHTFFALNHSNIPKGNNIGTLLKFYAKYLVIDLLILRVFDCIKNYKRHIISLSCWTISKESIHQIQRLVRNYIWSGKEDHVTRAKVAWPILTTPKSRGGLGLLRYQAQLV